MPVPSSKDLLIARMDRVAEGRPGFFSSREGLGYLFDVTGKALLDQAFDLETVDALSSRLLQGVVAGAGSSGTVAALYHTRFSDFGATPGLENRRAMVFRPCERMGEDQNDERIVAAFLRDVAAVRDLLAEVGLIMPQRGEIDENNIPKRSPMRTPRLPSVTRETVVSRRQSWAKRQISKIGLALSAKAATLERQTHTERSEAAHIEDRLVVDGDTWNPTGFEQTTVILQYLQGRLGLDTAEDLSDKTADLLLEHRFTCEYSDTGKLLYSDLREEELRLANEALKTINGMRCTNAQESIVKEGLKRMLRGGFALDALRSMMRGTTGGFRQVDWKRNPEFEMAFHLLVYAALYRGAARRVEGWLLHQIQQGVCQPRDEQDPDRPAERKEPRHLTLNRDPGGRPPDGSRPLTREDLARFNRKRGEHIEYLFPPFPAFVTPSGQWVFMPDAVCGAPDEWENPRYLSGLTASSSCVPNEMSCLAREPDRLPSSSPAIRALARYLTHERFQILGVESRKAEGPRDTPGTVRGTIRLRSDAGPAALSYVQSDGKDLHLTVDGLASQWIIPVLDNGTSWHALRSPQIDDLVTRLHEEAGKSVRAGSSDERLGETPG